MRRRNIGSAAGAAALLVAAGMSVSALPARATMGDASDVGSQPGMCQGRTDAGMVLNAHARGSLKFILNVQTDVLGVPTGALTLGRFPDRLHIESLCRLWQHIPGQEPGGGHDPGHEPEGPGEEAEGATIAHVVGTGSLADGSGVLVRADVRQTEEGSFFRVRYRMLGAHAGHEAEPGQEGDGHEEAWTRVPQEGWAPLDMLKLRPADL